MSNLHAAMIGFDITPRFHPQYGAWGTTPDMTEMDMPLLARCLVLEQDGRRLIWFGLDQVGDTVEGTGVLRREVAEAVGATPQQVIWSTSQGHSTGALPGSVLSGTSFTDTTPPDPQFAEQVRTHFIKSCIDAARQAIGQLQPVRVAAGRGFCDSISYNSRLPMPTGGNKFSREYGEALQSGKYFDKTIGLVRFDDLQGKPIGTIFNFCCHPAVLIKDKHCSPDWVGSARPVIEDSMGGALAMYVQGFCGDVHPRHMFGTPQQAAMLGKRLGEAAVEATLSPVRAESFGYEFCDIELECQPMPCRQWCQRTIDQRQAFIEALKHDDPNLTWVARYNTPEASMFSVEDRIAMTQMTIDYFTESIHMIDAGEAGIQTLPLTLGAVRIGDVAAALSPGENFTITGQHVRERSPFAHTLICGDTNGLFGYIGPDEEIDRGGSETEWCWHLLVPRGHRLPPAKGSAQRVVDTLVDLLGRL